MPVNNARTTMTTRMPNINKLLKLTSFLHDEFIEDDLDEADDGSNDWLILFVISIGCSRSNSLALITPMVGLVKEQTS